MLVIPATPAIYRQAMREGLIEIFIDAGATVSTSTCGLVHWRSHGRAGGGRGVREHIVPQLHGRMGHRESKVYLSGPAVAAASAVLGRLAQPDEVAGRTATEVGA